jgi:hypothetical protein
LEKCLGMRKLVFCLVCMWWVEADEKGGGVDVCAGGEIWWCSGEYEEGMGKMVNGWVGIKIGE